MNAQQRKYLIDTMKAEAHKRISELKKELKEYPSLANFLFKELMLGRLEVQSSDAIVGALKKRAESAAADTDWLSGERMGFDKKTTVKLPIADLIVIPQEYVKLRAEVAAQNKAVSEQIQSIEAQMKALELRINLATNSKLERIISEVDDMGDLSLIDTKLKLPKNG